MIQCPPTYFPSLPRRLWPLVGLLFAFLCSYAQPFSFQRIPNELGLSQNLVSALLQDSQGFIWAGTKDGLNRFDGYQFTVFQHDPYDSTSISGNNIQCLLEDRYGRLWIGTSNGLNLLNRKMEIFQRLSVKGAIEDHAPTILKNHPGLSDRHISSLLEDNEGNIWAGTERGDVVKISLPTDEKDFTHARFTIFRASEDKTSLWNKKVKILAQDEEGTIWVHGRDVLCLIRQTTPKGDYQIRRMTWEDFNPQWPDYRQEDFLSVDILSNEVDRRFYSIFQDKAGAVWIISAGGFAKWLPAERSFRLYPLAKEEIDFTSPPLTGVMGADGLIDTKGRIWINGLNNLVVYDTLTQKTIARYHGKDENTPAFFQSGFNSMMEDANGNIWVGTNGKGLYYYSPKRMRFSGHNDAQLFRTESLRAICQTRDGTVWAGTTDQKLLRINMETESMQPLILDASKWPRAYPLEFDQVFAIKEDRKGQLWVGGSRGLFRLSFSQKGKTDWIFFKTQNENETYPSVFDLHITPGGEIWLLSHSKFGRFDPENGRFDGQSFLSITGGKPEMGSNIPRIYAQNEDIFWLATSHGLLKYQVADETFTFFTNHPQDTNSLSHPIVKCISPDPDEPDRVLWIGTGGGGLNRFDIRTGRFTHLKKEDGLPDNVIYGILSDETGKLWMSTNQGISRFDPKTGNFKNYGVESGLQDNEFNSGAWFKNTDGRLFFGGIRGFNAFLPAAVQEDTYVPPIVITEFKLANRSVDFKAPGSPLKQAISQTKELVLTWKHNIFSFEFAALDFTNPQHNRYAYKLENFDDKWQNIGTQRSATFTNIDPGEYTFRVKGTNHDGTWNESGASLTITILPPWWKTWWACLGYALLLGAAGYTFYRSQLNRKLELAEAEKVREMDALKSRLYTNITHEFRTPLTVIMGISDELSANCEESPIGEKVKQKLKYGHQLIQRNSQNLLLLINQLLDLSKLESGSLTLNLRQADIIPYLQYLTESFFSMAEEKKIRLVFYPEVNSLVMDFDEVKMQQIVYNLLSNAIKFTEKNGKIVFHAQQEIQNGNPFLKLKISDTGTGIPAASLPYIFDRFFQADDTRTRRGEGTGIGLALTKELVELMDGQITVKSEPEKGTTFTILLPVHRSAGMNQTGSPTTKKQIPSDVKTKKDSKLPVHAPTPNAPFRVLLVEDNPDVTFYIHQLLDDKYQVGTAADGQAGIDMALECIPDIIISDVMMPEKDGFELTEILKNDTRTSHIPIILLTAKAAEGDRISGLKTGADAYLMKPFNKEELLIRLEKLIELRQVLQQRNAVPNSADFSKKLSEKTPTLDDLFLQKIHQTIEEGISNPELGVTQLCEAVNLSNTQVYRKLKALTGESPNRYIQKIRLYRAKSVLETADQNISQIAYQFGFSDPNYFSRAFSKEFEVPPSEVRKLK